MSGTISENYLSRPFTIGLKSSGRELVYDIVGTDDELEVQTLLLATCPATYQGLILDSVEGEPIGNGIWKGHARYLVPEVEYTFDTGGGTKKMTQSYATIANYAPSGFDIPDFGGAIGVTDDRVEGVETDDEKFDWTETHVFPNSTVTDAYKQLLKHMTGRWNNATFKGRAAGECKFRGATGSNRGTGQWTITFRFSDSENVSGLSVAGMTIDKLGWDYLWYRYGEFTYTPPYGTTPFLVKLPISAHVERIALNGDFSTLLIGT